MFKVILFSLLFLLGGRTADAQTSFKDSAGEQENTLSKYINASAVCAKMTDPVALFERGMLLLNDANGDAYMAAADCFTSAAMRNHTPSQLELGKLYEKGNGVTASNIFAYKWYQTAVLLGNQKAVPFRNSLEARMTLDEISMANPMIQSTLDLIELFNQHQQMEIERMESRISDQYKGFGINIEEYDVKEEGSTVHSNPLIEALIRDQQIKDGKLKGTAVQKTDDAAAVSPGRDSRGREKEARRSRRRRPAPAAEPKKEDNLDL